MTQRRGRDDVSQLFDAHVAHILSAPGLLFFPECYALQRLKEKNPTLQAQYSLYKEIFGDQFQGCNIAVFIKIYQQAITQNIEVLVCHTEFMLLVKEKEPILLTIMTSHEIMFCSKCPQTVAY